MAPTARLRSLLQASLALNSALDIDDVLRVLSQFVPPEVECERATLYLVDGASEMLVSHVVWPARHDASIRLPLGTGIAGWVAENAKPLVVNEVREDPRFDPSHDARTGFHTRSLLAVPIRARDGRVLGVLQALNKSIETGFDDADLEFVSILATHAAVSLQNARVFETLTRERNRLSQRNQQLEGRRSAHDPVGSDPAFVQAVRTARKVAKTDAGVLLRGESGTGKGVFAKMIHRNSQRARQPFVELNCAALPRDLVESEILGVESGVATGVQARKGKLETAHRGTCFLDEIGDMALEAQAKVLKAIEDRKIERVGGRKSIDVDVRIIAATHQDLTQAIEEKRFRADLYYRLDVVSVVIPALRDRGEDVILLAEHFAQQKARHHGVPTPELAGEVLEVLRAYSWPGNVRELENVIERAVVLAEGETIVLGDLPPSLTHGGADSLLVSTSPTSHGATDLDLKIALERTERALLRRALDESEGVQTIAAQRLGISESNLRYRLKKLQGADGS